MPALIDLRRRIRSVRNTQQITQAMKTVATAKFKKAQRTVMEGRPFWHNGPGFVADVAAAAAGHPHPLLERREEKRIRMLVVTSDKGLAGAFNSNLLEESLAFLQERREHSEIRLTLLGKKAVIFFRRLDYAIDVGLVDRMQKLTEPEVRDLAGELMREFTLKRSDAVYVAYNEFKSILAPKVSVIRLLPLERDPAAGPGAPPPDWEPGAGSLLHTLLPRHVEDQLCHCVFESVAAEHAARMMAMDNATSACNDMIENLTLAYNKARQAAITAELMDIVGGAEALKG